MEDNTNQNNGMITKIWGPSAWTMLHCISFGYPIEPTNEQKKNYMDFYKNVGKVLPCKYCRISYDEFINTDPFKLCDKVMKDRKSLTFWLYKIHEKVNNKLNMHYELSYDQLCEKYESYRAKCVPKEEDTTAIGCVMPLSLKANSYKVASVRETPIIHDCVKKLFIPYANSLGIFCEDDNKDRYKLCREIIEYMKINNIDPINKDGINEGLPCELELKLILMNCSNMCTQELINVYINNADKLSVRQELDFNIYVLSKE